jgi:predicted DNA-binding transcriptional regulator AlpA
MLRAWADLVWRPGHGSDESTRFGRDFVVCRLRRCFAGWVALLNALSTLGVTQVDEPLCSTLTPDHVPVAEPVPDRRPVACPRHADGRAAPSSRLRHRGSDHLAITVPASTSTTGAPVFYLWLLITTLATASPRPRAGARRWATLREVCAYSGFSERTIRQRVSDGDLAAYIARGSRVLRFDLADVDDLIAGDGGRRLRDKDAGDLLRLMKSSVPPEITATFDTYAEHELIGASVTTGRAYLVNVLASPVIRQMAKNSYEGEIDPLEVETDFELWATASTR